MRGQSRRLAVDVEDTISSNGPSRGTSTRILASSLTNSRAVWRAASSLLLHALAPVHRSAAWPRYVVWLGSRRQCIRPLLVCPRVTGNPEAKRAVARKPALWPHTAVGTGSARWPHRSKPPRWRRAPTRPNSMRERGNDEAGTAQLGIRSSGACALTGKGHRRRWAGRCASRENAGRAQRCRGFRLPCGARPPPARRRVPRARSARGCDSWSPALARRRR